MMTNFVAYYSVRSRADVDNKKVLFLILASVVIPSHSLNWTTKNTVVSFLNRGFQKITLCVEWYVKITKLWFAEKLNNRLYCNWTIVDFFGIL